MRRTGLSRKWIVWVGGVDDHYQTKKEAQEAAKEWREKGYDDVQLEKMKEEKRT